MADWILILVLLNMSFWVARFLKPIKQLVDIKEKMMEENQRCKFELAKAAEEISLIRKHIEEKYKS